MFICEHDMSLAAFVFVGEIKIRQDENGPELNALVFPSTSFDIHGFARLPLPVSEMLFPQ